MLEQEFDFSQQRNGVRGSLQQGEQLEGLLEDINDLSAIIPRRSNQELFNQIKQLQEQLQEYKKMIKARNKQIDDLKRTCNTSENQVEMQKKRISNLQERARVLQSQNKCIKKNSIITEQSQFLLFGFNGDHASLQREYNLIRIKYDQLSSDFKEKQKTIEQLRRQISFSNEIAKKFERQLRQKIEIIQQFEELIANLQTSKLQVTQKLQIRIDTSINLQQFQLFQQTHTHVNRQLNLTRQYLKIEKKRSTQYDRKRKMLQKLLRDEREKIQLMKEKCHKIQMELKRVRKESQHESQSPQLRDNSQENQIQYSSQVQSILLKTNRFVSTSIDSTQQKIRFLNAVIMNAETQLEKIFAE